MSTSKKILIVDGNAISRKSLNEFFSSLGYDVAEAHTGLEAVERASTWQPDLIMMAVCLPGLNGDEVTAKLKRNLATRRIPIVISTGWTTEFNSEERITRAVNAGAAQVLYKPFQLPVLRDVLRTHMINAID
ncbi:MAG TPA: response regulator [Candidatus Binatia bacterium]|jgi:CheY-like chemotaxis protein